MSYCTVEEAGERIIWLVINYTKKDFQAVVKCSCGSDVLIVSISMILLLQEFSLCKAIYKFATGEKQRFFNVHSLSNELGNNISLVLPFFTLLQGVALSLVVLCNILTLKLNVFV